MKALLIGFEAPDRVVRGLEEDPPETIYLFVSDCWLKVTDIWVREEGKMPAKISKTSGGKYKVATPNAVHAKGTTKSKAEKQARLLNAIDHGFVPTKKK